MTKDQNTTMNICCFLSTNLMNELFIVLLNSISYKLIQSSFFSVKSVLKYNKIIMLTKLINLNIAQGHKADNSVIKTIIELA